MKALYDTINFHEFPSTSNEESPSLLGFPSCAFVLSAQAILQAVTFRAPAEGTSPAVEISTYAQRAVWNTQAANEQMCVLMVDDFYGISWNIIEIVLSFSWDIVYNWVTVAKKRGYSAKCFSLVKKMMINH